MMMFTRSRTTVISAAVGACLLSSLALISPAQAQLINGDFHTSDGTNNTGGFFAWTLDGNNQIETSNIGSGPTGGDKFQALIENSSHADYSVSGTLIVHGGTADATASNFETFVGVTDPTLTALIPAPPMGGTQTITGGSAIKQAVTLKTGDKITFDYNFLANGSNGLTKPYKPYNLTTDIAFVHITDGTANTLSLLGNTTNSAFDPNQTPVVDPFTYQTATNNGTTYATYSFTAPEDGTYTFALGDALVNGSGDTGLLVDNFTFTPAPPLGGGGGGGTTPEPGTAAMLGGMIVSGIAIMRRRRAGKASQ